MIIEIQWKGEWKNTKTWKAKGKAMDTNTGSGISGPGYQSQPNNLETHLVGPSIKDILKKDPFSYAPPPCPQVSAFDQTPLTDVRI